MRFDSTYYDDRYYYTTLKFEDVFPDSETFIALVEGEVGGVTDHTQLAELYNLLHLKYFNSYSRYTVPSALARGIKRELIIEFPLYLNRKTLIDQMMRLELEDIMKGASQLTNRVEHPNDPTVDADSKAIKNLSTEQISTRLTTNELDAITKKYAVMNKDFIKGLYNNCDQLFKVILSDDTGVLYGQEG